MELRENRIFIFCTLHTHTVTRSWPVNNLTNRHYVCTTAHAQHNGEMERGSRFKGRINTVYVHVPTEVVSELSLVPEPITDVLMYDIRVCVGEGGREGGGDGWGGGKEGFYNNTTLKAM